DPSGDGSTPLNKPCAMPSDAARAAPSASTTFVRSTRSTATRSPASMSNNRRGPGVRTNSVVLVATVVVGAVVAEPRAGGAVVAGSTAAVGETPSSDGSPPADVQAAAIAAR